MGQQLSINGGCWWSTGTRSSRRVQPEPWDRFQLRMVVIALDAVGDRAFVPLLVAPTWR
ncbi:hypothetical protein [Actinomadura madurae]|uniref:hypothetical protein n=1 Tax=Actinomadura madurae TaxID=1993 RepID=UPI0020D23442|nr:hypothetical protein [Actinomadura madurae]MCP9948320.1 hypothetical protein [Actinomadura madurae]MCP9965093.1 hypothetical protein [Actinomadura madurae]MCP9977585.1 hypothetical protein [Actinomadura madurae]MCQ0010917.1 hypothetical protein [Actinomadura madurae]MCQ0013771.1 hypothetical protein [Actinomadura madurae]